VTVAPHHQAFRFTHDAFEGNQSTSSDADFGMGGMNWYRPTISSRPPPRSASTTMAGRAHDGRHAGEQ
jgi:hypothetical protein